MTVDITPEIVLSAKKWSELGLPHDRNGLKSAQRRVHPDVCHHPEASSAFAALTILFDAPEFSVRLAEGQRTGVRDHEIKWTVLSDSDKDLVKSAWTAMSAFKNERWVPKARRSHGTDLSLDVEYGEGWWFLSDFSPESLDGRTSVWVFRRLLAAIAVCSADNGIIHPSVDASKIVVNPREHGLMLDGWWGAVKTGERLVVAPDSVFTPPKYLHGGDADEMMSVSQSAATVLDSFTFEDAPNVKASLEGFKIRPRGARSVFDEFARSVKEDFGSESKWHELPEPTSPMI